MAEKKKPQQEAAPQSTVSQEEFDALKAELDAVKLQADTYAALAAEMTDTAKRLQADFENFRKRNVDSVSKARTDGENDVIEGILPALDVFDAALKMIVDENVAIGVKMIKRKIVDTLATYGVEAIPSLGEDFNPEFHEAIEQVDSDDEAMSGKVVEVLQQGYRRGNKVLRCSMVKVAR